MKEKMVHFTLAILVFAATCGIFVFSACAGDLAEVKEKGVLRHLGIPYANFVTGSGDGLDVELMKMFAEHLGVRYEFVPTSWETIIGDLTGKKVKVKGDDLEIVGDAPVKGDVIANGFTVLPWREKIVDFSTPTFPTQVWLMARADSPLKPIKPSGNTDKDIEAVRALLKGHTILGKTGTCLDPALYNLESVQAKPILFPGSLNDLAPALIKGESSVTLLDVPDSLVALEKWPGQVIVIGPLSHMQDMGCAFAKSSPELRKAFNEFFAQCLKDGTYRKLIDKYYSSVLMYYPEFFKF